MLVRSGFCNSGLDTWGVGFRNLGFGAQKECAFRVRALVS